MELKLGYKQTEVGVIPEDWEIESLERIADPKRPICYGIVQVGQFTTDGITVLAIKNLNGDYVTNIHRCSHKIERAYIRSRVHAGDVLISVKGTIGRIGLVPSHFTGNISRDLARIAITDADVPEFWHQMLQSEMAQRRLEAATVGTTRMELSIAPLKQVTMPRPPKKEQRAIAEALSDVDGLLGGLDRLIAKKRDLKQAGMQQLLTGQTRLPGFHGEWGVKAVAKVASITKGIQLHANESNGEGQFPHFNGGIYPSSYTDKSNCSANTIAISEGGNSCGYVQFIKQPFWCGGHCYAVVPKDIDNRFLYHALKGKQPAIMGLRVGSGLPNVQKTALADFKLFVPSDRDEQTAIAAVLSDMDDELAALEQRREKTRDLKQAMMQELLTGKTRLVAAGGSHARTTSP
jgi:type I restriction enzyme, S subunit